MSAHIHGTEQVRGCGAVRLLPGRKPTTPAASLTLPSRRGPGHVCVASVHL